MKQASCSEQLRRETLYGLAGVRLDAYDAVVKPDQVLPVRLYTLRRWAPRLGATGFWLLVTLQQQCYRNPKGPDWCIIGRAGLAEIAGVSEATVQRYLHRGEYSSGLCHWIQTVRGRKRDGSGRDAPNRYHVVMDAPLARVDQRGIAQLMQEKGGVPGAPSVVVEAALKALAAYPLDDLMVLCEEAAARFRAPVNWDENRFYPTVAEVMATLGLQTPSEEKEATAFHRQCSRVQQAFMGRTYLGTQYFRREWVPVLGHKLALAVLQLRSRCFWSQDEVRDEVELPFTELAQEAGCSAKWLRTINETHPVSREFFRVRSHGSGRSPVFQVTLVEPVTPRDQAQYEVLLRSGAEVPERQQTGLAPAQSSVCKDVTGRRLRTEPMNHLERKNGTGDSRTEPVNHLDGKNGTGESPGTEPVIHLDGKNGTSESPGTELVNHQNGMGEPHVNTTITVTNTYDKKALKKQQQTQPAATAIACLLGDFGIGPPNDRRILDLNPAVEDVRAWMVYTICEPGLEEPGKAAGYVVNRLVNQDEPPERFRHWAKLTADEWRLLWRASYYGGSYVDKAEEIERHLAAWQGDFESVFPDGPFGRGRIEVESLVASVHKQLRDAPGFHLRLNGPVLEAVPDTKDGEDWLRQARSDLEQICERQGVYHAIRICPCLDAGEGSDIQAQATDEMWQKVLSQLQLQMTRSTFETLLRDTQGHVIRDGVLQVIVPNPRVKEWLDARLMTVIQRTLQRVTQDNVRDLEFVVAPRDATDPVPHEVAC